MGLFDPEPVRRGYHYADVLKTVDLHRRRIRRVVARPELQLLMWEATKNCNLSCFHCCNQKTGWRKDAQLDTEQAKRIFSGIAEDFHPKRISLSITGGEPTVRKDLLEMVRFLSSLSFKSVGIVSNGLRFMKDPSLLDKFVEAGLTGLTISVDGLKEGHKWTRGVDCFHGIMDLLRYAVRKYNDRLNLHTHSVVNNYNKDEIPGLMGELSGIGIRYARVSLTYEVGRAETADETHYKLRPADLYTFLQWLSKKRRDHRNGIFPMEIGFTEDGWCGLKYELLTKPEGRFFFCTTGITVASILYDGRISACPHIPLTLSVQGSALEERFSDVWENRFKVFRDKNWLKHGKCKGCEEWDLCKGGPLHYRDENGVMKKCLYDEIREADDYGKMLEPSCTDIAGKGRTAPPRLTITDVPADTKIPKGEWRNAIIR